MVAPKRRRVRRLLGREGEGRPKVQRSCHVVNVIVSMMEAPRIAVSGFKFQDCGQRERGAKGQSEMSKCISQNVSIATALNFRPGCPWSNEELLPPPPPPPWEPADAALQGGTLSYISEVLSEFSQRSGGGCRTNTWSLRTSEYEIG